MIGLFLMSAALAAGTPQVGQPTRGGLIAEATDLLLNGEPHLPVGLLDQGYWPDGGYTAPTDEALAYDVELAKSELDD